MIPCRPYNLFQINIIIKYFYLSFTDRDIYYLCLIFTGLQIKPITNKYKCHKFIRWF